MKKKMKVAVMDGIQQLSLQEKDIPIAKQGEVLIALEYVGICGSDLHYYEHGAIGDYVVKPPFVLGHEAAGTIIALGEGVTTHKVGDRVAIEPQKTCGVCEFCKTGRYNLCNDVEFFATPPIDGVFQEYVAFPAELCFPLPANVSTMEGALMEPLAVGFHAASQGDAKPGKRVMIMGAGCIGLVCMQACIAMGVSQTIVVDMEETRLAKAKELGADHVICAASEDVLKRIDELTKGGCDIAIETAGTEVTTRQCIHACKKGANIVLVGYSRTGEMKLPMSEALDKELSFQTVFRYRNNYPTIIEAVANGLVNVKDMVTNIYPLPKAKQAMDDAIHYKKDIVKAVIQIREDEASK